jgi:hypothetical protein
MSYTKIQCGFIDEVNREDTEDNDRWITVSAKELGSSDLMISEFIEWLNDCDDGKVHGFSAEDLSNLWFRVI